LQRDILQFPTTVENVIEALEKRTLLLAAAIFTGDSNPEDLFPMTLCFYNKILDI